MDYEKNRLEEWKDLEPFVHATRAENLPDGMYLHLFHGRDSPTQQMDNWGYDGPTIGPFTYFHVIYLSDITYGLDATAIERDDIYTEIESPGPSYVLSFHEGLLVFHRPGEEPKYFGDWSLS